MILSPFERVRMMFAPCPVMVSNDYSLTNLLILFSYYASVHVECLPGAHPLGETSVGYLSMLPV
jgi:hypothetical protein